MTTERSWYGGVGDVCEAHLVLPGDGARREPGILMMMDYEYLSPADARSLAAWLSRAADVGAVWGGRDRMSEGEG
jgi:hypothetical protein